MRALLIAAHGSRKPEFNQEILALVNPVARLAQSDFDLVRSAFIQFAEPTFEDQVAALVATGATQIVVLPYFTAAGSHVRVDIPRLVDAARQRHPHIELRVTPHLGALAGIQEVIVEAAKQSL